MTIQDAEDHRTMLMDCERRESQLSDWERGFIDSAQHRIDAGKGLTSKQAETLDHIWERVTARG